MWKKGALLLVGTIVGLLLAEWLAAASGLAPEVALISVGRFRFSANPAIGYEPVPDFEYRGRNLDYFEFRDRSNGLGFRDSDHATTKQPGITRILVIGDSVTMGLHVKKREDVFPFVMERALRLRGREVEVLNFGVSGYNTGQEVATLIEKGLAYQPDWVLLQYSLNDTQALNGGIVDRLRAREAAETGVDQSLLAPLLARSALYRLIVFRVMPSRIEARRGDRAGALERLEADSVEASFVQLRQTAEAQGFEVLVVVFPELRPYGDEQLAHHERVRELTDRSGFRLLDLKQSFDVCAAQHGQAIAHDPMHPSALGHRCAGRAIADYLEAELPQ